MFGRVAVPLGRPRQNWRETMGPRIHNLPAMRRVFLCHVFVLRLKA